jgi:HK97 family phage major capsid protein
MPVITADLIPSSVSSQLLGNVYTQSVALALGRVQNIPAGVTSIPVIGARPVAGFVNPVGAQKPFGTLDFTAIKLTAEELACTVAVPQAYIDDAGFPLWDNVRPLLAEAIAKVLDAAILLGTGAPASFPVGGVLANSTATTAAADYSLTVNDAMTTVEGNGYMPNGHAADVSVRGKLRGLRSAQGVPLYIPDVTQAGGETLYGLPIRFTQPGVLEPGTVEFFTGDWTKLIIGVRQDLRFDTSTDATLIDGTTVHSMFQEDSVAMRAYMRVGAVIGRIDDKDPWAHIVGTAPVGLAASSTKKAS